MLAISGARLWRGEGTVVSSPALVVIDAGRLVDIDSSGAAPPPGAEVVDLGDVTLLPGLIDAHVYLCSREDVLAPLQTDDDATLARMEATTSATLAAGVTTGRDLGDMGHLGHTLRERYGVDAARGPELLVAGPPLTPQPGSCWFLGGEADDVEQLRAAVAERAGRGCDVVKVMATGGVITPGFAPHESQHGPVELRAVVDEATATASPRRPMLTVSEAWPKASTPALTASSTARFLPPRAWRSIGQSWSACSRREPPPASPSPSPPVWRSRP